MTSAEHESSQQSPPFLGVQDPEPYSNTGFSGRFVSLLRGDLAAGIIVMFAALAGFLAANSPLAVQYFALREWRVGIPQWHLELSLGHWASDGLLAIFFFLVGLELKREFVVGALRKFSTAIVPVVAAVGGVAAPAILYVSVTAGSAAVQGWAIPTATDIAFAVAILGLLAPGVSPALRMFLLTLAVVDDLIAIVIIAVWYTSDFAAAPLLFALVPLTLYAVLARRFAAWFARARWAAWGVLFPLGVASWALFHLSGIHATIAGVVLAFVIPVRSSNGTELAANFEHRFAPLSSFVAVPIFAFFAAGVPLHGEGRFPADPIALGVLLGLVFGKPIGITLTTWVLTRFSRAELDPSVRWRELIGVASLAGVGFTVSLLISELSFHSQADADTARLAVMVASLCAVAVSAVFLVRNRHITPAK